jgi:hypothetical protein
MKEDGVNCWEYVEKARRTGYIQIMLTMIGMWSMYMGSMFSKERWKCWWYRGSAVGEDEKRVTDGNLYSGGVIRFWDYKRNPQACNQNSDRYYDQPMRVPRADNVPVP